MTFVVIGLGNPGAEYEKTRHNIGRLAVEAFAKSIEADTFDNDASAQSLVALGHIGTTKLVCALPETFMNKSGVAAAYLLKTKKAKPENIIVVYDDMDLPAGSIKIAFDRGAGGHRGVESIIKHLKTKAFVRVRIGVSPTTPTGKLRKPQGEDKVVCFLLASLKEADMTLYKKVFKKTNEALAALIEEGRVCAMNAYN